MSIDVYDSEVKPEATTHKTRPHRSPKEYSQVLASASPAKHSWSAYMPLPTGIGFDSQDSNEKVLLFLRQHPIVNVRWICVALLMILGPIVIAPFVTIFHQLPGKYQLMLSIAWYLVTAAYVIENVLYWLFNAFVITDERMIDLDFYSILLKEANYAQLNRIQDISTSSSGFIYTLMDVGSVHVQTAGEVPEFSFDNVAHPSKVVKLLNELIQEEEREALEGRTR